MRQSSSRSSALERPTNKSQSQRQYRSKEIDGFIELRNALLLVDPFDTPLGRDATRHQLLITAARKLRNLAEENRRLILQLSAMSSPTRSQEHDQLIPGGITTQNATASDLAWSNQWGDTEHLRSTMALEAFPSFPHFNPGAKTNHLTL